MLENSLLYNAKGEPLAQPHKSRSKDWPEIKAWTDEVYMPYTVAPTEKGLNPTASMHSAQVGSMIVTRFKYGVPVRVFDWSQESGNIILLTTLQGKGDHVVNKNHSEVTQVGESFLVDCSQTDDYAVQFVPEHLQLNLTIPHQTLADLMLDNFGHEAPQALWEFKTRFGGVNSAWMILLQYLSQSIAEIPKAQLTQKAGEHLQQMICLHILNEWAMHAKINLNENTHIAPKYIQHAEQYMQTFIRNSPTLTEVASSIGVSVRTLSAGFKKYRNKTPGAIMRDMRLTLVRQELRAAHHQRNVAEIAYACGYSNLGEFARQYKLKYGELPSQTLKQL